YDPLSGFATDAFRSDPANGSNNWAVHGSRTRNGHALLANDTHLGLNLPPIWFPVQLSTPAHRVFGFTLPGACGVVIGHNDRCAWGVTNAPRDTRDWYRITWKDAGKRLYLHNGRWLPVGWRVETIGVRGANAVVDSIRMTLHGPVVFDERFGPEPWRHDLALRWLGHDASRTQRALMRMNRARGHADHVVALRDFDTPAQNWVFASVDDTIAMRVQGRFPNKWPGQGRFVLNGADTAHLWQGFIPFEHTATQVNPARGFVSSANQHSVDEAYPYWFFNSHLEYYRNRSVNRALSGGARFTPQDMMALQHSPYDLRAAEGLDALLPLMDTSALDAEERQVLQRLRRWDRNSRHDGEEAALFQLWFDSARAELWRPLAALKHPVAEPTPYNTIRI
ncbi:MAG: penicillin acylase family protein, partial [Flavobacteriales bacterium]